MSTTFAVIKKCKCGEIKEEIKIAHRSAQGQGKPVKIKWLNSVIRKGYKFMDKNIKVYPIDNSNQGVYNIGDLIKLYNEYKNGVKK